MRYGIIGGSGLYDIPLLEQQQSHDIDTLWGKPSGALISGRIHGCECVFLARHGQGHRLSPTDINYRANIAAMRSLGVTHLISVSACGSLQPQYVPGHFVMVDQFIDWTRHRVSTFFEQGLVAHVSMAEPICGHLSTQLYQAAQQVNITAHQGGTYLVMEGPQFSSKAESNLYRQWGCDVIGMTNMPEAKLACEAQLCYASVAMVTDYDCWHEEHDNVDVSAVLAVMKQNTQQAIAMLDQFFSQLQTTGDHATPPNSLENAIVTAPAHRDGEILKKLAFLQSS